MEPLVTIAIPDLAGSAARTATLSSLARHTRELYEVILLEEEPSRPHVSSGSNDQALRQIVVAVPFGTPAAGRIGERDEARRPPRPPVRFVRYFLQTPPHRCDPIAPCGSDAANGEDTHRLCCPESI